MLLGSEGWWFLEWLKIRVEVGGVKVEISLRGTGMMEFGRGGFFFEDVEEGSKIILVVSS